MEARDVQPSGADGGGAAATPSQPPPPTATDSYMVVMRHSVRLDEDPEAVWPDRATRPYDPPITDRKLPCEQAKLMLEKGFGKFDVLICSPYRRCLQTGALVSKELGIPRLQLNTSVGEVRRCVRRIQKRVLSEKQADGKVVYLDKESVATTINAWSDGQLKKASIVEAEEKNLSQWEEPMTIDPSPNENDRNGKRRLMSSLRALFLHYCIRRGQRILVVTHGDAVDASVREFVGGRAVAYDIAECAWAAYRLAKHLKRQKILRSMEIGKDKKGKSDVQKKTRSNETEEAQSIGPKDDQRSDVVEPQKIEVKLEAQSRFQTLELG
mmetsp:Transcript_16988/g.41720  ORF Transcript_16988/g.41720 Transcript_16988/m.41720 type:complete len:325 (+) Transcript_16988:150-1124(+)|eukprot:CAMPEP_0114515684 /NCGR_PEP_ID=MMETSP0109-20121206/16882_1 /TAXON_ID=29199 /ORGANISM="Chlorarachnion reptans, Strain CCCM449" /LENGTH=324 /DNA_ID=CAMNT_0001695935 /DNA_START=126 /DNA_END=1100 /DNA_ORIENTATION=+